MKQDSYKVGDKVVWRNRTALVVEVYNRVTHPELGVEIPLRSLAYRLRYVRPQHDKVYPYGRTHVVAFADEMRLIPKRVARYRQNDPTPTPPPTLYKTL